MSLKKQNLDDNTDKNWKSIYTLGGFTALIVILGTILDIYIGTTMGSDLSTLPKTATERFAQFQDNWMIGLYNLDMLNFVTTILMIPTYMALCVVHRRVDNGYTLLATIIYIVGAAVFITNNTALSMLELSSKYAASTSEVQKISFAAAGEAMLSRGAHGSLGAFPGFLLLSLGSIVMSFGMLKGKIFSKTISYVGIIGSVLLLPYVILVTFVPETKKMAMIIAAPGGLLALAWMIMFTIKLFKLGCSKN